MHHNHFDVRTVRERLELTVGGFAAALDVPQAEVRKWEAGTRRVPKRKRQTLEYLVARADWEARMRASGLPECEWVEGFRSILQNASLRQGATLTREIRTHVEGCETCRAREDWAAEHLPRFPTPPTDLLGRVEALVLRLPPWARPAAVIAILGSTMMAFAALIMLAPPMEVLVGFGIVLGASAAGGAGGLGFSLTRPALARLGWIGDYLSGIVFTAIFIGVIALLGALVGKPLIESLAGVVAFGVCTLLFGTIVGKGIQEHRELSGG